LDLAVNGIDCAAACHRGFVRECTMGLRDFVTLQTVTLCGHRDLKGRLHSLVFFARVFVFSRTFSVGKLLINYCVQLDLLHEAEKNRMLILQSPVVTICTASLTFSNSKFCPHSLFLCFVWIWEQPAIISLYSINWLVFISKTECVHCTVRTGCSCITEDNLNL
jgi:hypothetical protein